MPAQPLTLVFLISFTAHPGPQSLRLSIGDCPALREQVRHNWFSQLSADPHPALESIGAHVNPRARFHAASEPADSGFAWDIVIDEASEPIEEPMEMQIARTSAGINFSIERRRLPGIVATAGGAPKGSILWLADCLTFFEIVSCG